MLFDSPVYFVFLALVVPLYWQLERRQQNIMLLFASYVFYGWWDWRFLSLILISTVVDYNCARYIARSSDPTRRRLLLAISVGVNLTFLGFFKYFNFFADSLHGVLGMVGVDALTAAGPAAAGHLFSTHVQELAYIVDVTTASSAESESPVDYALFIRFSAHLIAGPIQRPHLHRRYTGGGAGSSSDLLILSGLFRMRVADGCALLANAATGQLDRQASQCSSHRRVRVSCSRYTATATATSRAGQQLLGFHFMVNFRQPYLATSIRTLAPMASYPQHVAARLFVHRAGGGTCAEERLPESVRDNALGGFWLRWTFVVWWTSWLHAALRRGWRPSWGFRTVPDATGDRRSCTHLAHGCSG
jgi:hypothetical protein